MSFADLGLSDDVLRAVVDAGYTEPTAIQEQAIPQVLMGRDILGCAQTGTGKTASFTLPMIDILASGRARARMPRTLILEPTRELAAQVAKNFEIYGKYNRLSKALIIGGESLDEQFQVIDRGVDVLIATPGRLIDHFDRGALILNDVKILVIDEADRMLDMGFIPDVERIVSLLPKIRQTLFFSATMPKEIRRLADQFLLNPKEISVAPPATPADMIIQNLVMVRGGGRKGGDGVAKAKREVLRTLLAKEDVKNALIFCNRKRDVDILKRSLTTHGFSAAALHGDMHQSVRTETMESFRKEQIPLLVCSDVAARGLDITGLSHVFIFDVPTHAEDYVHRIGRTGRAGLEGRAFMLASGEDTKYLAAIENLIGKPIPKLRWEADAPPAAPKSEDSERPAAAENGHRQRSGRKRPERQRQERPAQTQPDSAKPDEPAKTPPPSDNGPDEPVLGLGDHVPAFLMRGSKPAKKKAARRPRKRPSA